MTNSSPWYRWSMEIDGLPINSMVENNQRVILYCLVVTGTMEFYDFPYSADWWFGTCLFYIYIYIGNVIIPTDELIIFQRGRYTTNQFSVLL